MNSFEDDNLPPELGDLARQLRDNRDEGSPLELDQAKQRVLRRTNAPKSRRSWIRRPAFITAMICALSIGAGSATAFNLPFSFHFTPIVHHVHTTAPATSASSPLSGLGGILSGGSSSAPSASGTVYNPFLQFLQDLFNFLLGLFGL